MPAVPCGLFLRGCGHSRHDIERPLDIKSGKIGCPQYRSQLWFNLLPQRGHSHSGNVDWIISWYGQFLPHKSNHIRSFRLYPKPLYRVIKVEKIAHGHLSPCERGSKFLCERLQP